MSDTWTKEYCPSCKVHNWVNDGDLEDCTVSDIEGVCCHSCNKVFLRFDREDMMFSYGDSLKEGETLEDYVLTVYGRNSPDDPFKSYIFN